MSIGQKPLKGLAFYQQRGGEALVPRGARRQPILAMIARRHSPAFPLAGEGWRGGVAARCRPRTRNRGRGTLARRPGRGYIREMRDLFDDLFRPEPIDPVE